MCNCLRLGKWIEKLPYIHKKWTLFETPNGSDYSRNNGDNPRYGFELSMKRSSRNSWHIRDIAGYSVFDIIRKIGCEKKSASWVSHLLSLKINAMMWSTPFLSQSWWVSVLICYCRPYIHNWTSETKEESNQWVFKGKRAQTKARIVNLAGKIIDTVFFDARTIIYTDYLPNTFVKSATERSGTPQK